MKLMIVLVLMVLTLSACSSDIDKKNAQILDKILILEKVPHGDIRFSGDEIVVYYETSDAGNYDAQLVGDWGAIFGAAANFDYESTIIVNTVGDEEYVRLTARNQDTLAFVTGAINDTEFWTRVDIKS